ncbi:MAG: carboxymuconolactone decarboxylase family protein [Sphingomicrobium sp.]
MIAANPHARHDYILCAGPRILPLDIAELTPELEAMILPMIEINTIVNSREADNLTDVIGPDASAAGTADHTALLANLPEIMRTMLRHPALFVCQTALGIELLGRGSLPPRDRELAILRMGWLCQAPYEWGEHVLIAKKVGVTSEEIERITIGSTAPGWSDHDRTILRAVEELRDTAMISDATWATLSDTFDEQQMIELPILIGQYQAVAYYQNSLRLRLHDGNLGLDAR